MTKACGLALSLTAIVTLAGCASLQQPEHDSNKQTQTVSAAWYQNVMGEKQQLLAENQRLKSALAASKQNGSTTTAAPRTNRSHDSVDNATLAPPNADPNACYARVKFPAEYRTRMEKVLISPRKVNVTVEPATFHKVDKKVLVRAAYEELKVIPATYKTVSKQVKVQDASSRLKTIPARYETVSKKVMTRPAYTEWRKGPGKVIKMNELTGEVMHLVTIPAEYVTFETQKLVEPEHTVTVELPAVYKTIEQRVVDQPAHTVTVTVPAVYKTLRVTEQATPPKKIQQVIPAVYKQVEKQVEVTPERMGWSQILCDRDATKATIIRLQAALKIEGYNPHEVDGIMGPRTRKALSQYQKAQGLPVGFLTLKTLERLGVKY